MPSFIRNPDGSLLFQASHVDEVIRNLPGVPISHLAPSYSDGRLFDGAPQVTDGPLTYENYVLVKG